MSITSTQLPVPCTHHKDFTPRSKSRSANSVRCVYPSQYRAVASKGRTNASLAQASVVNKASQYSYPFRFQRKVVAPPRSREKANRSVRPPPPPQPPRLPKQVKGIGYRKTRGKKKHPRCGLLVPVSIVDACLNQPLFSTKQDASRKRPALFMPSRRTVIMLEPVLTGSHPDSIIGSLCALGYVGTPTEPLPATGCLSFSRSKRETRGSHNRPRRGKEGRKTEGNPRIAFLRP